MQDTRRKFPVSFLSGSGTGKSRVRPVHSVNPTSVHMNLHTLIANIHWLQVIVLTLCSFVIGFAWHTPYMFGHVWKKENGVQGPPGKGRTILIFGLTAVLHLMAFAALSAFISGRGGNKGILLGFIVSFFCVMPAMGGTYLFANRSMKLFAIDAGLYVFMFSLAGLVLGAW